MPQHGLHPGRFRDCHFEKAFGSPEVWGVLGHPLQGKGQILRLVFPGSKEKALRLVGLCPLIHQGMGPRSCCWRTWRLLVVSGLRGKKGNTAGKVRTCGRRVRV